MSLIDLQNEEPKFWSTTSWIQIAYGVWVNQAIVGIGLAFGFSSVAIPQLRESDIKLTLADEAWLAGILTLSAPLGSIANGIIIDRLGRRAAMIACVLPMGTGWLCTGLANTPVQMIIGRVITGLGLGMSSGAPRTYTTEIAKPNMRGVLGAFPTIAMALGVTVQAILGKLLYWNILCFISGSYMFLLMVLYSLLPETPYYRILTGTILQAEQSILKFRGKNYESANEMKELKKFKLKYQIHRLSCKESFKALFKPSACKPFSIIAVYTLVAQLSGCTVLVFWGVELVQNSKSSLDAYFANIVLGVARLIGGILTAIAIFKVDRRGLALFSATGVGITAISIGIYTVFTPQPTVFPIFAYAAYMMCSVAGYLTLPLLMLYEMAPLQIRGLLGGISVSWFNFVIFAVITSFPFVHRSIGLPVTLIGFGLVSLLGGVFLYFFLPETKNLTLYHIEELFKEKGLPLATHKMNPFLLAKRLSSKDIESKSLVKLTLQRANSKLLIEKDDPMTNKSLEQEVVRIKSDDSTKNKKKDGDINPNKK